VRRRCAGAGELDDEGMDCADEEDGGNIIMACRRLEPVTGSGMFSTKGKETGTMKSGADVIGRKGIFGEVGFASGAARAGLRGIEGRGGEETVTRDGGGEGDGFRVEALGGWELLAGAEGCPPLSRSSSSSSSSSLDLTASSLASTQSMTRPIVIPVSSSLPGPRVWELETPSWSISIKSRQAAA